MIRKRWCTAAALGLAVGAITVFHLSNLTGHSSQCSGRQPIQSHGCSSNDVYEQLNEERKHHLQQVCQSNGSYGRKLHFASVKKEMFYFRFEGLNWCPVFKAASTSVNEHMCPMYYDEEICNPKDRGIGGVGDLWRGRIQFTRPVNGTNFIVVRNPFHRVLSGYNNKLGEWASGNAMYVDDMYEHMIVPHRALPQHLIPHKAQLKAAALVKSKEHYETGKAPDLNPDNPYEHPLRATFPEFISALISGWVDDHWISVNNYCAPCTSNYQYIIKVEDFSCEFNSFLAATGQAQAYSKV